MNPGRDHTQNDGDVTCKETRHRLTDKQVDNVQNAPIYLFAISIS